jgi:hypothetical protein
MEYKMKFEIHRIKKSHCYQRDSIKPSDWGNNDANNSIDDFIIFNNEIEIFRSKCQTVSNSEGLIDGSKYLDTIDSGPVSIVTDVDRRKFWCRIHGLINAKTIGGEIINGLSVTSTNQSRWLIHDWQKLKPNRQWQSTRAAWSAGCFVLKNDDLVRLGEILDNYNVKPGTIIPGQLLEA